MNEIKHPDESPACARGAAPRGSRQQPVPTPSKMGGSPYLLVEIPYQRPATVTEFHDEAALRYHFARQAAESDGYASFCAESGYEEWDPGAVEAWARHDLHSMEFGTLDALVAEFTPTVRAGGSQARYQGCRVAALLAEIGARLADDGDAE